MGRSRPHLSALPAVLAAASAALAAEAQATGTTWRVVGLGPAAQSCEVEAFADAGCSEPFEAPGPLSASCGGGSGGEGELRLELPEGARRPRCLRVPLSGGLWPEQDPLLEERRGAGTAWLPRPGIEVRRAEGQRRLIFFQASSFGLHPALAILGSIGLVAVLAGLCNVPTTDIYLFSSNNAEDPNYGTEVCRCLGESLGVSVRRHRSGREASSLRGETLGAQAGNMLLGRPAMPEGISDALPLPSPQGVVPQPDLEDRALQTGSENRMHPYAPEESAHLPGGRGRPVRVGSWQLRMLDALLACCPAVGFCFALMYVGLHAFVEGSSLASGLALLLLQPAAAGLQAAAALPVEAAYRDLPDGEYACRIVSWCLVLVAPAALSLFLVSEAAQQPAPVPEGDAALLALAVLFLLASLAPPIHSLISDVKAWSRIYRSLSVECPEFPWLNGAYKLQEASPCTCPVWMKEHDPWAGRRWMHSAADGVEGQKWCFSNTSPQSAGSGFGAREVVVASRSPHGGSMPQELVQDAWVAGGASRQRPSLGTLSLPLGDSSPDLSFSDPSRQSPVIVIIKPGSFYGEQERGAGARGEREAYGWWARLPCWRRAGEDPDLRNVEPCLKVVAPCHPVLEQQLQGRYELCLGQTFREHPVWQHEGKDAFIYRHPVEERWAVGLCSGRQGLEQEDFAFNEGYLMSPLATRGALPYHFCGQWSWKPRPREAVASQDSNIRVEVFREAPLNDFPSTIQVFSPNQMRECEGEYTTVYGMTSDRGYPVWRQSRGRGLFLSCARAPPELRRGAQPGPSGSRAGGCLWCLGPRIMREHDFCLSDAWICGDADKQPHLANLGGWWVWSPELGRHDIDPDVCFFEGQDRDSSNLRGLYMGSNGEAERATVDFPTDGVKVSFEQYATPELMDYQRNRDKWEEAGLPPPEVPPELAPEPPDPRVSYPRRVSHGKWFGARAWMHKAAGRTSQEFADDMRDVHEAQEGAINAEAAAYPADTRQWGRRGSVINRMQAAAGDVWGRLSWRRGAEAGAGGAAAGAFAGGGGAGAWGRRSWRREARAAEPGRLPQRPLEASEAGAGGAAAGASAGGGGGAGAWGRPSWRREARAAEPGRLPQRPLEASEAFAGGLAARGAAFGGSAAEAGGGAWGGHAWWTEARAAEPGQLPPQQLEAESGLASHWAGPWAGPLDAADSESGDSLLSADAWKKKKAKAKKNKSKTKETHEKVEDGKQKSKSPHSKEKKAKSEKQVKKDKNDQVSSSVEDAPKGQPGRRGPGRSGGRRQKPSKRPHCSLEGPASQEHSWSGKAEDFGLGSMSLQKE